jgi:hypothetical protein
MEYACRSLADVAHLLRAAVAGSGIAGVRNGLNGLVRWLPVWHNRVGLG